MITTVTLNSAVDKTFYVSGLKCGQVNKASKIHITAGAKGINVSRVLNVLGDKSVALGFAGGYVGNMLMDLLRDERVDFDFVKTKENTRLNAKILDLKTNQFTEINEGGSSVSDEEMGEMMEKLEKYLPRSPYMVLGGSVPYGMADDIYYRIIKRISGAKVYLDCGGKLLLEGVKAAPYFVKPNLEEFSEMIGVSCKSLKEAGKYVDKIMNTGIEVLVITDGPRGSIAVKDGKLYEIIVPEVQAKSTVGAGDSFLAGFVHAQSEGMDFFTCLKVASSCSVAKVVCDSSMVPDREKLLSFVDDVKIKEFV